jgi:glutaredoxin 2
MKASRDGRQAEFLKTLADRNLALGEDEYRKTLAELEAKPGNYAFVVTKEEYRSFYHDLLTKTSGIVPVGQKDLEIPKRLYLEANGLTEEPRCAYCGNKAKFVNRKAGYSDSCGK